MIYLIPGEPPAEEDETGETGQDGARGTRGRRGRGGRGRGGRAARGGRGGRGGTAIPASSRMLRELQKPEEIAIPPEEVEQMREIQRSGKLY